MGDIELLYYQESTVTVARSEAASEKKYRANQISLSEIRWASPTGSTPQG